MSRGQSRTQFWHEYRVTLRISILLLTAAGLGKLLDLGLVELNRRGVVLPQFDLTLIPYHDPRVTRRHALLREYQEPPQIIFTGDSRTKNGIVPEVISRVLGVPRTMFFNFGTGSQVVKFSREVFVPHLLQIGVRPAYVVFGVSPDWPLRKERLWALIDRYRDSLAYRIANRSRRDGPDSMEVRISRFLDLRLALFRYRADLIHQELIPSLGCWFLGDCNRPAGDWREDRPLHFRDLERRSGFKTGAGWGPQPYDGHTSGRFASKPRFSKAMPVDQENLLGLFSEMRKSGIKPLLLIMPVHPSFREAHADAMARNQTLLEQIAGREGVGLLHPQGDYRADELFVDGHHLSHLGAVYFSADIAASLAHYLEPAPAANPNLADTLSSASIAKLLTWIYETNPAIPELWHRQGPRLCRCRETKRKPQCARLELEQ